MIDWLTAHWPDIFDWLTKGNAPGYLAVLVATVAARFAYRSSKASRKSSDIASQQLARLEDDRLREYANGFALWSWRHDRVGYPARENDAMAGREYYQDVHSLRGAVQNTSTLALRDVSIYVQTDVSYFAGHIDLLPPTQGEPSLLMTSFVAKDANARRLALGALFVDAQRRHWHRLPTDELVPLTEREHIWILVVIANNARRLRDQIDFKRRDREQLFRTTVVSTEKS